MLIAIIVGALCGVIGTLCLITVQLALNMPGVYNQLAGHWYFMPPAIGACAAILAMARKAAAARSSHGPARQGDPFERKALPDLFESFHFGIFVLYPIDWLIRAAITAANVIFGGIFGLEGGVLELGYASLPLLSHYLRLFIEEKQTFTIGVIAASLGVALAAPFSGALIALELAQALEARVRAGAVVASLTAFGAATALQHLLFPGLFTEGTLERLNVVGALFAGMRPLDFDPWHWVLLGGAAIVVGAIAAVLGALTALALDRGAATFAAVTRGRVEIRYLATGVLVGLVVWMVPDAFTEPWRLWDELAWVRVSPIAAMALLVTSFSLLALAFSGWGSSGIFSPILGLGALLGYALGNAMGTSWAIPLAIAGASAMLASVFGTPMAAAALVLEIGRDGPMWGIATLAVISAAAVGRFLGTRGLQSLLLERQGLRVVGGRVVSLLSALTTNEAMYKDVSTIEVSATLEKMRQIARGSHHNFLGVISERGEYLGLLALERLPSRIRRVLRDNAKPLEVEAVERVFEIRDLLDSNAPTMAPGDSLEKAVALLQHTPCLAVVDADRTLRGFLFESSIAGRYKREVANTLIRRG
jgi:H+/Cl- antiporter ClcA